MEKKFRPGYPAMIALLFCSISAAWVIAFGAILPARAETTQVQGLSVTAVGSFLLGCIAAVLLTRWARRREPERLRRLGSADSAKTEESKRGRFWSESFDRAELSIIVSNVQSGTIAAVNPYFAMERGYEQRELVGSSLAMLFPPDRIADLRLIAEQFKDTTHGIFETEHVRKDGSRFPVLLDITVLRNEAGNPEHRVVYAIDISERKRVERELAQAHAETAEQQAKARRIAEDRLAEAIRARMRAESLIRALHDSEERLTLFVKHAPAALAMFDRDMRYLSASRRWIDDYALDGAIILGKSHYEVFPEIGESWREAHRRGLAGEVLRSDEDRFVRADGATQWIRWEIHPWRAADGSIGGIVIFTEDITRYKQAIEAQCHLANVLRALRTINRLITQERDPRLILGKACSTLTETRGYRSAWIGTFAPDGTFRASAESALRDRFGALLAETDAGEVPGCCGLAAESGGINVVRPGDAVCAGCALGGLAEGSAALVGAIEHEGTTYGTLVVSLPAQMADDEEERSLFAEILGDIAFALHDIDIEGKRAAAAADLRRSEHRFATAFSASPAAIGISVLEDGRMLDANDAFLRLFGFSRDEVIGRTADELAIWPPGDRRRLVDELLERKHIQNKELTGRRKDGELRELLVSLEMIELGGEFCILGILNDITERKRDENRIRQALSEKEALLRELYHRTKNNMLTIVAMMTLRAGEHPESTLEDFVEDLDQKIRAMALVHGMLYERKDLSRIDLGGYLRELARLAVESAGQEDRIGLEIDTAEVPVTLDTAVPLGLAANELITNSLRHAFPENRRGTLSIALTQDAGGKIELRISDDGVGFPSGFDLEAAPAYGLKTAFAIIEEQVRGTIAVEQGGGTRYRISFRADLYEVRV